MSYTFSLTLGALRLVSRTRRSLVGRVSLCVRCRRSLLNDRRETSLYRIGRTLHDLGWVETHRTNRVIGRDVYGAGFTSFGGLLEDLPRPSGMHRQWFFDVTLNIAHDC